MVTNSERHSVQRAGLYSDTRVSGRHERAPHPTASHPSLRAIALTLEPSNGRSTNTIAATTLPPTATTPTTTSTTTSTTTITTTATTTTTTTQTTRPSLVSPLPFQETQKKNGSPYGKGASSRRPRSWGSRCRRCGLPHRPVSRRRACG